MTGGISTVPAPNTAAPPKAGTNPSAANTTQLPPDVDDILILGIGSPWLAAAVAALTDAGLKPVATSPVGLMEAIRDGSVAALVLTGAAFKQLDFKRFVGALEAHPCSYDLTVIAIDFDYNDVAPGLEWLQNVATVVPVERSDALHTVVHLANSALRLRRRHRSMQQQLKLSERAEQRAGALATELSARVEQISLELADAAANCAIGNEQLSTRNERNRAVIELSELMLFTTDLNGHLTSMDARFYAVTGLDQATSLSVFSDKERVHPEDRARVRANQLASLAHGTSLSHEYRGLVADGSYRWWQMRAAPVRDAHDTIIYWNGTLLDIHDRKVAEERLRASEELHRYSMALSSAVVFTAKPDGRLDSMGDMFFKRTGLTPEAIYDRRWNTDLIHPDDISVITPGRDNALAKGSPTDYEMRIRNADGSYLWWHVRTAPDLAADGSIRKWYGTVEEIDNLKRAEEKLRRSEELHRFSLELSELVVWTATSDGKILSVGSRLFDKLGIPANQLYSKGPRDYIHPDDFEAVSGLRKRCLEAGSPADIEFRVRHGDYSYHWWRLRAAPVFQPSGSIIYGTLEHIDDLKRAEAQLRESEQNYRYTVELSNQVVLTTTPLGVPITLGDNWQAVTGYPPEILAGSVLRAGLCHPDDAARVIKERVDSYRTGKPIDQTVRIRNPHGAYEWWRIRGVPREAQAGGLAIWYFTVEVVDALVSAQLARQQADAVFRHIVETSGHLPWMASPDGSQISLSGFGIDTAPDLAQFDIADFNDVHPDNIAYVRASCEAAIATGAPIDIKYKVRALSGDYKWWRSRGSPHRDADGRIVCWYGTLEKVDAAVRAETHMRQLQAEMEHLSRLQAMGTMATTLAHELNQPLSAVVSYISGSRRLLGPAKTADAREVAEALRSAEECALRAGTIIRKVRDQTSRKRVSATHESVAKLIKDACKIALVNAEQLGITTHIILDPAVPTIYADGIQVQQVLINFIRNAVDALECVLHREILITTTLHDGFCAISVCDSGAGIDPVMTDRLYKPYETSKPNGLGIGLSISRTIAEANGGRIEHGPSKLGGASFTVTLPTGSAS